jgi:hypothetical protein
MLRVSCSCSPRFLFCAHITEQWGRLAKQRGQALREHMAGGVGRGARSTPSGGAPMTRVESAQPSLGEQGRVHGLGEPVRNLDNVLEAIELLAWKGDPGKI